MCVLAKEGSGDTVLPVYKMWAFKTWGAVRMGGCCTLACIENTVLEAVFLCHC